MVGVAGLLGSASSSLYSDCPSDIRSGKSLRDRTKKPPLGRSFYLVGVAGFEPTNDGIKNRCLTTWRYPNRQLQKQYIRFLFQMQVFSDRVSKKAFFLFICFLYLNSVYLTCFRISGSMGVENPYSMEPATGF